MDSVTAPCMTRWKITELAEVASTNTLAKELLLAGQARHGDVIQARHQTAGRGRAPGRQWQDETGNAVLMTLVIERVPVRPECMQYMAALATLTAIRELVRKNGGDAASVFLKWPNDILMSGKKVCGILTEAIWQGTAMRAGLVGIGVNVHQKLFFGALEATATSFHQLGIELTVNEVRDAILHRLQLDVRRYKAVGMPNAQERLLEALRKELAWMSDTPPLFVTVHGRPVLHDMIYAGIGEAGTLLLRNSHGEIVTLHAGSIEWDEPVRGIAVTPLTVE